MGVGLRTEFIMIPWHRPWRTLQRAGVGFRRQFRVTQPSFAKTRIRKAGLIKMTPTAAMGSSPAAREGRGAPWLPIAISNPDCMKIPADPSQIRQQLPSGKTVERLRVSHRAFHVGQCARH